MSMPDPVHRSPDRLEGRPALMVVSLAVVVLVLCGAVVAALHLGAPAKAGTEPQAAAPSAGAGAVLADETADRAAADATAPDLAADPAPAAGGELIVTPCFEYRAPTLLQNVSTAAEAAGCITDAKATVRATVDGVTSESVWGEVLATSVVLDSGLPPDADTAFDTAWATYFQDDPAAGGAPRETVSLDGAPAQVVRLADAGATLDAAVLVAYPPHPYTVDGLESQVILITFIAPKGSGDTYVQQVLDTWRWA